ncbi:transposase [Microbacterium sp.]|uniref:IS110 family transposase n=1 Tax=Microbacterium sp. TaxID=51671 RepID=UPI0037CA7F2D
MTNQLRERVIVGGVDTHKLTHHAAIVDAATGKLLGDQEFAANTDGYKRMRAWFAGHGTIARIGIEGTGSYGAGLQRHLQAHNVTVIEVARQNRQRTSRSRQVRSDRCDQRRPRHTQRNSNHGPERSGRVCRSGQVDSNDPTQRSEGSAIHDQPDPWRPLVRTGRPPDAPGRL